MDNLPRFTLLCARDAVILGLAGCLLLVLLGREWTGWSFLAGCLWMGLNLLMLGWLIGALVSRKRAGGHVLLLMECAKIPLAYLLLFWLCTRKFVEPMGLAAGIATLPLVILLRGLAGSASHFSVKKRG
jgi:hypothetical protein